MRPLSLESFTKEHVAAYDEMVLATADIDQFCSSSDWILPAHLALVPGLREPFIYRGQAGFIAMMSGTHSQGWSYLESFEPMWGLASPLVGQESSSLARDFATTCWSKRADWQVICLSGLFRTSALLADVIARLKERCELVEAATTGRHIASLAGGVDGFMARRSRNFRRSLKRSRRRARADDIEFESSAATTAAAADQTLERILAVERTSWKGLDQVGIDNARMTGFYRIMGRRLAARGAHRVIFARHHDRDVAYIFGGIFASTYRGLQLSFAADYRDRALGNLCQYHQIVELCAQGVAEYDLGTAMDYKQRWAETVRDSPVLLLVKNG